MYLIRSALLDMFWTKHGGFLLLLLILQCSANQEGDIKATWVYWRRVESLPFDRSIKMTFPRFILNTSGFDPSILATLGLKWIILFLSKS